MPALTLPETLDRKAAFELSKTLLEHRGSEIELDASGIQRLGAIGVEVLIAAQRLWHGEGIGFQIDNWSEPALQSLNAIGVTPDLFQTGDMI